MRTLVVAPSGAPWAEHFPGRLIPLPEAHMLRLAGTDAARRLRARFALRTQAGRPLAPLVRRYERVVAPSTVALPLFAEARAHGVQTVLIEDVPDMRGLHRDLDLAAERHPGMALLRRFRAPAELVARQEQERLLADRRLVFSRSALDRDSGAEALHLPVPPTTWRPGPAVLLAGPPLARGGVIEALAACEALGLRLVARGCETREAPVALATAAELSLEGVCAVLAPAWAESWPTLCARAVAAGVPLIGSAHGVGLASHTRVQAGDVAGLQRALAQVLQPA